MIKEDLRKQYLQKRLALSPKELEIISEKITHSLFSNFQFEKKKISMFLPIERTKEINTYRIWEKALSFDAQVAIPKLDEKSNEIKQILFESEDQLEISSWGIPEPNRGRIVAAEHFDIIIVPLLAIDQSGQRVGYGKGYYDRFLSKCSPRCKFIGLSHFDDLADKIEDCTPDDIRLDACVTPNHIYRFDQ
ncbi:MAG: 5-formyltetrahydrofolate cyclo-ligase [Crocinitomicaceae bacterium]|jgi:5-formyltetrahydrofolate cyclo-ligase